MHGLADDVLTMSTIKFLAGAVDQHETQVVRILDGNRHRHVLYDGVGQFLAAIPLFFRTPTLGDILVSHHPSTAVRDWLGYDSDDTTVGQVHRDANRILFGHRGGEISEIFLRIDRKESTGGDALLDEVAKCASWFNGFGWKAV